MYAVCFQHVILAWHKQRKSVQNEGKSIHCNKRTFFAVCPHKRTEE